MCWIIGEAAWASPKRRISMPRPSWQIEALSPSQAAYILSECPIDRFE